MKFDIEELKKKGLPKDSMEYQWLENATVLCESGEFEKLMNDICKNEDEV
jgi:hypothetical protein